MSTNTCSEFVNPLCVTVIVFALGSFGSCTLPSHVVFLAGSINVSNTSIAFDTHTAFLNILVLGSFMTANSPRFLYALAINLSARSVLTAFCVLLIITN